MLQHEIVRQDGVDMLGKRFYVPAGLFDRCKPVRLAIDLGCLEHPNGHARTLGVGIANVVCF
jgi:hypothetical protein